MGVLVSFHYFKKERLADLMTIFGDDQPLVFADSGGFSAMNAGATIDVAAYSTWLQDNADTISYACTLDVVGDHKATAKNTKRLEADGHRVVPVFHVTEPWKVLEKMCEEHQFVALGGMVPHSHQRAALHRWIAYAVSIGAKYGTQFHGFGITAPLIVGDVPLFSIDSTTWKNAAKYGAIHLWDDMRGWVVLPSRERRKRTEHRELLRSYGLAMADVLRDDYGMAAKGHREEYITAGRVLALAHVRFERWYHERHAPITVTDRDLPAGPHLFLACNPADLTMYVKPTFDLEGINA